jgi:hypothetical protein
MTVSLSVGQPFFFSNSMHRKRSQSSLVRNRLSKTTSEMSAQLASLACTTVSRNEYPIPTRSSIIRRRTSQDETPRKRSIAPECHAICCQLTGKSDARTLQFSSIIAPQLKIGSKIIQS